MYREEHVLGQARAVSGAHSGKEENFSALVHAHQAVRPMGDSDVSASRRMVESLREAAEKSFDAFIHDPMLASEDDMTRHEFEILADHLHSWQQGDEALSELINHMNETLACGALQAHVSLCERFISVHNIFSLLQLKQIQMQTTHSLAVAMSHTAQR